MAQFSIMFSAMLTDAFKDCGAGFYIRTGLTAWQVIQPKKAEKQI